MLVSLFSNAFVMYWLNDNKGIWIVISVLSSCWYWFQLLSSKRGFVYFSSLYPFTLLMDILPVMAKSCQTTLTFPVVPGASFKAGIWLVYTRVSPHVLFQYWVTVFKWVCYTYNLFLTLTIYCFSDSVYYKPAAHLTYVPDIFYGFNLTNTWIDYCSC